MTQKPAPVVAIAWSGKQLIVVSGRGKDVGFEVLKRPFQVQARGKAVKGALGAAALSSGEMLTVAFNGLGVVGDDVVKTGFAVSDVLRVGQTVWASGQGLARFDEKARAWVQVPLDVEPEEESYVHLAPGARGLLVAVETARGCVLRERDGETWVDHGQAPASVVGVGPAGAFFAVDQELHRRAKGSKTWERLGVVDDLGGLGCSAGGVYVQAEGTALRLDDAGVPTAVLTKPGVGSPAAPFATDGARVAFAMGARVWVLEGEAAVQWFGPAPEDPASVADALAKKALKKPQQRRVALRGKDLQVVPRALLDAEALEVLDLSQNLLAELPADFGRLTELRELNLHLNALSTLPPSFAKLTKLEALDLGMNTCLNTLGCAGARPLREVPRALRGLRALTRLNLAMNELSELPDWLAELPLTSLDVSANRFARVPKVLGKLTGLTSLALGYQPYTTGVTPFAAPFTADGQRAPDGLEVVCGLTNLTSLSLDRLDLRTLPADLGRLTKLETLDVSFNRLTTVPESFFQLTSLRTLTHAYVRFDAATLARLKRELPKCELTS